MYIWMLITVVPSMSYSPMDLYCFYSLGYLFFTFEICCLLYEAFSAWADLTIDNRHSNGQLAGPRRCNRWMSCPCTRIGGLEFDSLEDLGYHQYDTVMLMSSLPFIHNLQQHIPMLWCSSIMFLWPASDNKWCEVGQWIHSVMTQEQFWQRRKILLVSSSWIKSCWVCSPLCTKFYNSWVWPEVQALVLWL